MRVEAFFVIDRTDLAHVVKNDLPFWQVQLQRLAHSAGDFERCVSGVKRANDLGDQRCNLLVWRTVHRVLDLFVIERGHGFHQATVERVADLVALGIDAHGNGETGTFNPFVQRAEVARQHVRQHRHNAVREVGGVTAIAGLAVKRGAASHVVCYVSDGDPDGHFAIVMGFDIASVIVVAGVPRVDCDQWRVAQIKAFAKFDGQGRVGLGDDLIWEMVGDAVLVDRDERDRARLGGVAKARDDTRNRQTHAALWS